MGKKVWVSYNAPIQKVEEQEKELEEQGYLAVDSYGNEFDMGNVFEYANGEDAKEVLQRHFDHMERCAIRAEG